MFPTYCVPSFSFNLVEYLCFSLIITTTTTSQTFYFRFSINNTLIYGTLRYKFTLHHFSRGNSAGLASCYGKKKGKKNIKEETSDHSGREGGLFFWLAPPPAVPTAGRPAPASSAAGRSASDRALRAETSGRLVGVPSRNSSRAAGNPALPGLAKVSSRPLGRVSVVETRSIDVFDVIF